MKTSAILVTSVLVAAAFMETVNFDNASVGKPGLPAGRRRRLEPGWRNGRSCREEHCSKQAQRAEAIGDVSGVPQRRRQRERRVRRGEVQSHCRDAKTRPVASSGAPGMRTTTTSLKANALENNVTIYHTINGRRTETKRASVKVAANQWHTLRVDFQANHFTVALNGQKALEWDDETFKDAGKVGVWTNADSVTLFDDFTYASQ